MSNKYLDERNGPIAGPACYLSETIKSRKGAQQQELHFSRCYYFFSLFQTHKNLDDTTTSLQKQKDASTMNFSSSMRSNVNASSLVSTKKRAVAATPAPVRPRMAEKRWLTTSRRCCKPMGASDRFIPNRSAMDASRASASLLKQCTGTTSKTPSQAHYETQLRRALFGVEDDEMAIMTFGSKRPKITPARLFVENHDPYQQDTLRSAAVASNEEQPQRQNRPPQVSMKCTKRLDAPNLLLNDDRSLLSQGEDLLAVAIGDEVFLWSEGYIQRLAKNENGPFSCVKWSNDKKLVALGSNGSVVIFDLEHSALFPVFSFKTHTGYVTAIAWNGMELAVACRNGITRYNLLKETPRQATYAGHGHYDVIALVWSGHTIASASGEEINLWDSRKCECNIQPRTSMEHAGVKSLEINPRHPNILVSSGKGGLKFWNLWSGALRRNIFMESRPTKIICSRRRDEILVAHGSSFSLWSLGPKVEKLMEHCTTLAKIIGMEQGLDGTIICLHENECMTVHDVLRQVPKEKAQASLGGLRIPALR